MTRSLQDRLRELAEEAPATDLTVRAQRTARRLRRRRQAVAAAGAAAMVSLVALGTVRVAASSEGTPVAASRLLGGTAIYLAADVDGFPANSLQARMANGRLSQVGRLPRDMVQVTLSPDGTMLAGIRHQGDLVVAGLDGRRPRTVATGLAQAPNPDCRTATWQTARQLVYAAGWEIRSVNADGTGVRRLKPWRTGCVPAMSPDGGTLVSVDPEQPTSVVLEGRQGDAWRFDPLDKQVANLSLPPDKRPLAEGRFSPDGRWLDALVAANDPIAASKGYQQERLLFDTRTLNPAPLQVAGAVCDVAYLRVEVVVRTCESPRQVIVLDSALKPGRTYTEPSRATELSFLGMVPA